MNDDIEQPTAMHMLAWLVEAYTPEWKHEMGAPTGYRCYYCRETFGSRRESLDPDNHKLGCQWAQSKVWLRDNQEHTP